MSDFRKPLYERYVSDFKGDGTSTATGDPGRTRAWKEYKYSPLFEGLQPDSPILELGCGAGHMLAFLKERGFQRASGIDISAEQIHLAQAKGCDAVVADGLQFLGGKPDTFDAIIAFDFVEHFHKEELLELMPSIFTALRKGGRFIVQTPNGEGLLSNQIVFGDMTHLTIFTPGSLKQLLQRVGFRHFQFFETGPVPHGLRGLARVGLWRGIRTIANLVRRIETGKTQALWTENMICCCERPQ